MEYFVNAYRLNYVNFQGRARRSEYWTFVFFAVLGTLVTTILDVIFDTGTVFMGYGVLTTTFFIFSFLPFLSLRVRRLHDSGKSGWFALLSIIPLLGWIVMFIFMLLDSDPFENKWGPNPKAANNPYDEEIDIESIGEDL